MIYDRHIDNGDRLLRRVLTYSLIAHLLLLGLICWQRKSPAPAANMVVELQELVQPGEGGGADGVPAPQPPAPPTPAPPAQPGLRPALQRSLQPTLTQGFERVLQPPQQRQGAAGGAAGGRGFVPYPVYRGNVPGVRGGASPFPDQQRRTDAAKAFMERYSASRR